MKKVSIYNRKGFWYIHSMSQTVNGLWIGVPPYNMYPDSIGLSNLGDAVNQAFTYSLEGVPHPTDWNQILAPLLELSASKNWSQFMKAAANVEANQDGDQLYFEPSRNAGARIGYVALDVPSVAISIHSTAAEIGVAVQRAIAMCE
jgi:hypothetical protein